MLPSAAVLLGNVGTGKSTLVEKVTGTRDISSDASGSFTKASQAFVTDCQRLLIVDTPGSNAMADKLLHNVWIAHALNFAPVSIILLVVKADTRIDNTVDAIRYYAECFQDLSHLLGVCVTHMDTVGWRPAEFLPCMRQELGMDTAVFVGLDTPRDTVLNDILGICKSPENLMITSNNFLKYFKISNSNLKILNSVRKEVTMFESINAHVLEQLAQMPGKDKVDLVFEYQAYMKQQIVEAQRRVSVANAFTFFGAFAANEAGHIANLTNQLRAVLYQVRTMALGYQSGHGISDLRRCPSCGLVWAKIAGCNGGTTCGNRMNSLDVRDANFSSLGTFTFEWDGRQFQITKNCSRAVTRSRPNSASGVGCGASISWNEMAPVVVPSEFRETIAVTTDDVELIPQRAKRSWEQCFDKARANIGDVKVTKMKRH